MPYKERGLTMFRNWEPDPKDFDPEVDRLLVTTNWGDTFVVRPGPNSGDSLDHVIDPLFMPDNMGNIPKQLKTYRTLPFDWDASKHPWYIFLYDGEMTSGGPFIEMEAVGIGWTRPIRCSVTIERIVPVCIEDIKRRELCVDLTGVHFGEFTLNEDAMVDAQAAELEKSLQS